VQTTRLTTKLMTWFFVSADVSEHTPRKPPAMRIAPR
jgi:hypothetical protein